MLNCNELQMVIATQKPNCKASCKSPHFLTMNVSFLAKQNLGIMGSQIEIAHVFSLASVLLNNFENDVAYKWII